jgi:hypothetical protein
MKKYLYHYTCLLLAFIEFCVWLLGICVLPNVYDENDNSGFIVVLVMLIITIIVLAVIDKFLRGIRNNGYGDLLFLTLVSPFRFFCQIITIIKVHKAMAYGNEYFGERGSTSPYFNEYIYYYLFNCENEDPTC